MLNKRAVIYTRVSDPAQVDNNSLDIQEKKCKEAAQAKGYNVIRVFREEGKSAKHTHTRPKLRELFNFCLQKTNKISAVFVYKSDRFSRNVEEGLIAISRLAKNAVEVISVVEGYENSPMGRAMRIMVMAMDQLDNELKGERVRDNMKAAFSKGLWVFKCPVGYKRKYKTKEENKGIPPVQDERLAPIITNMFKKAATGLYSKSQLAKMMNLEGFGDFYQSEASYKIVKKILSKSFYYGEMYAKKWNEYSWGKHDPLIDKPTWDQAYQRVIMKKKDYTYQDNTLYPLKGSLRCELCGHPMTTSPSRGNSGKVFYYECGNRKCRRVRIQAKEAHEQFIEILKEIKPSANVVKLFNKMVFKEWDQQISLAKNQANKLNQQVADLKLDLKSIRKAKDDGTYTESEAREEAEEIRQKIVLLEIERSDMKLSQYDAEIVREFVEQFLTNLDRFWQKLDLAKKQALQKKIFPDGLTCLKIKNIRTNELSPSFQLLRSLNDEKGENVTPRGLEPRLQG